MNPGRWGWRFVGFLVLAAALTAVAQAGARFHPVELVATALVASALWWMSADFANRLYAVRWEGAPSRTRMNPGRDFRLAYLTRLLGEDDLTEAHRAVTGIADRILATRYGVSRTQQPEKARAILGERLHDFVTRPPVYSPYDYHRRLPDALTRLEEL